MQKHDSPVLTVTFPPGVDPGPLPTEPDALEAVLRAAGATVSPSPSPAHLARYRQTVRDLAAQQELAHRPGQPVERRSKLLARDRGAEVRRRREFDSDLVSGWLCRVNDHTAIVRRSWAFAVLLPELEDLACRFHCREDYGLHGEALAEVQKRYDLLEALLEDAGAFAPLPVAERFEAPHRLDPRKARGIYRNFARRADGLATSRERARRLRQQKDCWADAAIAAYGSQAARRHLAQKLRRFGLEGDDLKHEMIAHGFRS